MRTTSPPSPKIPLGPALQRYFCSHLIGQRNVSPRTITAYRDSFRLLLRFMQRRYGLAPEALCVDDLNPPRLEAFLLDLEKSRGNCVRSRNARLAAIRSFMRYAAGDDPRLLANSQRVLAIPSKRYDRPPVGHLTREQMQAVLDAPDASTVAGQRDRLLLLLLYNTGARVSEVAGLRIQDVSMDSQASVLVHGKGRKQRTVPLWRQTVRLLRPWLGRPQVTPDSPLLPNARGAPLSRHGISQRLHLAVARAEEQIPALRSIRISPHTIRHTTAMHLLQSGVDLSVIALWLGHESIQTTHQYMDADLESKRRALACLQAPRVKQPRRRPPQPLIQFLEGL